MLLFSNKGFSLVELLSAMVLSSAVLGATTAFFSPAIKEFQASTSANELRQLVIHPLESLSNDVEASRAIYVDNTQCYTACMVDIAGVNRIYYFWGTGANSGTLYRKIEPVGNNLACTGGTTV